MMQEKIALLVDSVTDVPAELVEKYHMYELPLQIIFTDGTYTDKVDITPEEIYARMAEETPKTSLPDGNAVTKIFEQIKTDGYKQVLAVTISSGLSGTHNVVRLVAEHFKELETVVFDTKSIGIGAGMQAIRAARLIDEGLSLTEVVDILEQEIYKNKVYINVATLEYLQKGGRIGLVSSILGNALKLKPVISCNEEGVYYTAAKARGRKKSIDKTLEIVKKMIGTHQKFNLAVAHGDAEEEALAILDVLKENYPQVNEIFYGKICPVLVVHTGSGLVGVGVQILSEK